MNLTQREVNESGLNASQQSLNLTLEPVDNRRLANFCGQYDEHLRQLERRLGVEINNRGNRFRVIGAPASLEAAGGVMRELYHAAGSEALTPERVHLFLADSGAEQVIEQAPEPIDSVAVHTRQGLIQGRTPAQRRYLAAIASHDVNFGIGPAGTGKTYLAVASAVDALNSERVRRIVLVRPAVEAGERLGFLPGDMAQKVDPYLRPLYDALYEMLGFEKVGRLIERQVIEVAPLAFMRGRTLNESFVILDEAQNTTIEQMKMFLTRIGFGSTAVVTGDVTQTDLPSGTRSGLRHVVEVLADISAISFSFFTSRDVVRHPLVQRIIDAYEVSEQQARDHDGGR